VVCERPQRPAHGQLGLPRTEITHLKTASLSIAAILCAFSSFIICVSSFAAEPRPNIIFILSDDQGYGDLGRHGNPVLKTPNLDALYDQSVRFTDFCVAASCSPTRASLMTGMNHLRVGVTHTIPPREHMSLQATTLPQILKSAGYATALIGKWHLGGGKGYNPQDRGFDFNITTKGGVGVHFNPDILRNGVSEQGHGFREDIYFDEAMKFIDGNRQKPFFLYLATYSPHAPLAAPENFIAPYRGKVDDNAAKFFGMIANLDWNVGRLMTFLEEKKLNENTVVIFMNDNGGTFGVDTFNAGMRGCKCTAWQGGSRAMSFWRWPKKWQPHDESALTAHVDVLPTLAALAGATLSDPVRKKLEGRSLVPLLAGKSDTWFDDRIVFQHVARWPSGMAAAHRDVMGGVRWRDYLLVRHQPCDDPDGACKHDSSNQCNGLRRVTAGVTKHTYTNNAQFHWGLTPGKDWALYDVNKDPACMSNLSVEKPDILTRLHAAYEQWWDDMFPEMIAAGGDKPLTEGASKPDKNGDPAAKGEH
jgi:arylsulfatase A-like enzyme